MRYLKIIILVVLFIWASNIWGQSTVKVSGETEYFKYSIEITDSAFASTYKDSLDLLKRRIDIALLLFYAEIESPPQYRKSGDNAAFMPTYAKLREFEKIVADTTLNDERLIKAHNALVDIWDKLYAGRQWDVVAPIYKKQ